MRGKTKNVRWATQDVDQDFIRYSLGNDSIDAFVSKLNCIEGLTIKRVGKITELKQQDYHGKRIFVRIKDQKGFTIENKQPYTRCDTVCIYTLIFITVPGHVIVRTYEVTDPDLVEKYIDEDKIVTIEKYYEMVDGHSYKYRLEISGRMGGAVKNSTFVYLSNIEEISFDQAWKAAGISSNLDDYFNPEEAVLVAMK